VKSFPVGTEEQDKMGKIKNQKNNLKHQLDTALTVPDHTMESGRLILTTTSSQHNALTTAATDTAMLEAMPSGSCLITPIAESPERTISYGKLFFSTPNRFAELSSEEEVDVIPMNNRLQGEIRPLFKRGKYTQCEYMELYPRPDTRELAELIRRGVHSIPHPQEEKQLFAHPEL